MYNTQDLNKVRVWDLPTRLFHWALAVDVICLVVSGLIGGNAMAWHFRFGYMVLSLSKISPWGRAQVNGASIGT